MTAFEFWMTLRSIMPLMCLDCASLTLGLLPAAVIIVINLEGSYSNIAPATLNIFFTSRGQLLDVLLRIARVVLDVLLYLLRPFHAPRNTAETLPDFSDVHPPPNSGGTPAPALILAFEK